MLIGRGRMLAFCGVPFGHFLVVFGVDGEGKCSFAANAVTKRNIKITSQLFSLRGTQLTAPPQIPTISLPLEKNSKFA